MQPNAPERRSSMKRVGSTLTAERAAVIRNFEVVLFDNNRYNYFLDFLSQHNQAHKLLFWFDVEQFKLTSGNPHEMVARQEGIYSKYIDPASTSSSRLDNIPAVVRESTARLVARGAACGFAFALVQALVAQELREYWFEKFTASAAHIALVDHLRMTYPITLQELLTEGTAANGCLRRFVYGEGANGQPLCPGIISANYKLWAYLNGTMRPLCASVIRALDQLNVNAEGMSNVLAGLLDECVRLSATLTGEAEVSQDTRTAIAGRLGALRGFSATGMLRSSDMDLLTRCVAGLGDALLEAQQQTYHVLESRLVPVLKRSSTYARFVEDMLALECLPLQARQLQLNDIADVLRKEPDRLQESKRISSLPHHQMGSSRSGDTAGGSRWIHLFKPPQLGRTGEGKNLKENGKGTGAECGCWVLRESARAKDLGEEVDVVESRKLPLLEQNAGDRCIGGVEALREAGLMDPLLGMGECKSQMVFMFQVGVRESSDSVEVEAGLQVRDGGGANSGGGTPAGMGGGVHGCLVEEEMPVRGERGVPAQRQEGSSHKVKRQFRTYIDQLKHVVVPRASRVASTSEQVGRHGEGSIDVGVGHDPRDSSYQEERIKLNKMLLRLMEADLLECIPGYCLPGALAKVVPSIPAAFAGASAGGRGTVNAFCAPPTSVHHFVIPIGQAGKTGRVSGDDCQGLGVTHSEDTLLYGACLTRWHELKDLADAEGEGPPRSRKDGKVVYIPHCICALSPYAMFDTLRAIILEVAGMGGSHGGEDNKAVVKVPPSSTQDGGADGGDGSSKGSASLGVSALTLRAPPASRAPKGWAFWGAGPIPVIDMPLLPLFQVLSSESVMKALSALAMERPVVVTGSVTTLVVSCCEILLNLLHPLKWHYTYNPLIPASEVSGFWTTKILKAGGSSAAGGLAFGATGGGVGTSSSSAERGGATGGQRVIPPFFVGLDANLVKLAQGAGGSGGAKDSSSYASEGLFPIGPTTVWGVRAKESCLDSLSKDRQTGWVSTHVSNATLECVRRIVGCAVHIDLDNDEVNSPAIHFDASSSSYGQPLPDWPAAPLANVQRAVMMAIFPEFASFDSLSASSRTGKHRAEGGAASSGPFEQKHGAEQERRRRLWRRQRRHHELVSVNALGSREVKGEEDTERSHLDDEGSTDSSDSEGSDCPYVDAATLARRVRRLRMRHSTRDDAKGSSVTGLAGEAVAPMYRPTDTDRRLRDAFLVLMQEVLGRAPEYTQVFPEQGLAQLNTRAFMEAINDLGENPLHDGSTSFWDSLVTTKCFYSLMCELVSSDFDFELTGKLLGNGVGLPKDN